MNVERDPFRVDLLSKGGTNPTIDFRSLVKFYIRDVTVEKTGCATRSKYVQIKICQKPFSPIKSVIDKLIRSMRAVTVNVNAI